MADVNAYESVVARWETFLKGSKSRFIRIRNKADLTYLNNGRVGAGKSMFFWEDIAKDYTSVKAWLDALILKNNLKNTEVYFKRKSGGSGTADDKAMDNVPVDFSNRLQFLKEKTSITMDSTTEASQKTTVVDPAQQVREMPVTQNPPNQGYGNPHRPPAPFSTFDNPQYQQATPPGGLGASAMYGMGGAAAAASAAGMGIHEFTELKKNAERASEYKEELAKVKEENSALRAEKNTLESKVSIAEQAKDLAVQTERLNKRGFMDSEGAAKIMEMIPTALTVMAQRGNPQAIPQQGLSAPANLSPVKQEFVGYIQDDEVTDHVTAVLQDTLMLLLSNIQGYGEQLLQLNNKTKTKNAGSGNG